MAILICAQILFHHLSKLISSAVAQNKVLFLEKFILQIELEASVSTKGRVLMSPGWGPFPKHSVVAQMTTPKSACCSLSVPAAIWGIDYANAYSLGLFKTLYF